MLKRLTVAAAALSMLSTSAFAAGTVPGFSLAQQQDSNGTPLVGCKLYTIQAGTVATPQNAYQDSGLTIPLPNPVICDAYGRLPQIFLADGSIKLRLTKSNGTQVFAADGVLVVGASSGGGGGSPVDPTTIIQTGWIQPIYGTGVVTGFVRANGRTIGSATSGATERANADTLALFTFLYNQDVNLAVSGGRGANAAADYAANKTITLPDYRNTVIAGLGDMGSSDRGLFAGITFTSGNSTTLGSSLGAGLFTLLTANLPPYTPAGTNTGGDARFIFSLATAYGAGPGQAVANIGSGVSTLVTTFTQPTFNGTPQGGTSAPIRTVQPTVLATIYLKL